MKKIYLTLLVALTVLTLKASPDIYAPDLLSPANNATNQHAEVNLDWSAVTGQLGLYYEIQVSTTEDFANPAIYSTDLTGYKISGLLFNQDYFWRVRAIDNIATSDWSAVRKFKTLVTLNIKKPAQDAKDVTPNAEISWDLVAGLTKVEFQLDTSASFNSSLMTITSVDGKLKTTNAANLYFGLKYYVRIRGLHVNDTMEWNTSRYFTVTDTLIVTKPAGTSVVPTASFEWKKLEGLQKYQILLSQDPDLTQYDVYNVSAAVNKYVPDTLLFGTTYYWKLAGIHANDTVYSAISSFTTISKVTLDSPSNNGTNVELQPTLEWDEIAGLVKYQLEIANNAEFAPVFTYYIDDTLNTFKVPIHVLDSAHVYYWRVKAISSRDTSDYSDVWSFRTVTLGKEDIAQVKNGVSIYPSPAVNKVNINIRNTFNGNATIEVYDLLGTRHINTTAYFNSGLYKDLQVGHLPSGIYMVSILADGQRITSKLIIRK